MTNHLQKFKTLCLGLAGIAAFYYSFVLWNAIFGDLIYEFFLFLPRPLFSLTTFFLLFFLCRVSGTVIFMPKPKLKAMLVAEDAEPSLSAMVTRAFSLPFVKRVAFFTLITLAEAFLRVQSVFMFLQNADNPIWQAAADKSVYALFAGWCVLAFLIMELPWFFMFYKLSVPGHPDRMDEYRFGTKVFAFVLLVYGVIRAFDAAIPTGDSVLMFITFVILTVSLSLMIWVMMFRRPAACGSCGCPVKAAFKKIFCSCSRPVETKAEPETDEAKAEPAAGTDETK